MKTVSMMLNKKYVFSKSEISMERNHIMSQISLEVQEISFSKCEKVSTIDVSKDTYGKLGSLNFKSSLRQSYKQPAIINSSVFEPIHVFAHDNVISIYNTVVKLQSVHYFKGNHLFRREIIYFKGVKFGSEKFKFISKEFEGIDKYFYLASSISCIGKINGKIWREMIY